MRVLRSRTLVLAGGAFVVLALSAAARASATGNEPEIQRYRLHKFQQPIGVERTTTERRSDGRTEIRSSFAFTDRTTTVPLASRLVLDPAGDVESFEIWGQTSRHSTVDDRVAVGADAVAITHAGESRSAAKPERFFAAAGYAPVGVTAAMWSYWNAHGRPATLPIFPSGEVRIERRGSDELTNDDGAKRPLERYAIAGLGWGRETVWIDGDGRLVALKSVDAEFDHFEALAPGWSQALGDFVRIAADDGLAALGDSARASAAARTTTGDGAVAWVGGTLVDGSGAAPVLDAVVVVEGDRIVAAGPRKTTTIPRGAKRVDATGRFLLPGLWDMHAHFEQPEWGPLYLAAGVTTVRDCGNELDFIVSAKESIAAGRGLGPRILLACIVDGEGAGAIGTSRLRNEEGIPALISKFRDAGCSQVKIYSSLDPKLIAPLAAAAHAAGLTVTGHVPNGIGAVRAVEAGYDGINHLPYVVRALFPPSYDPDEMLPRAKFLKAEEEIRLDSPETEKTLRFLADRKIVIDPTFALYELFSSTREQLAKVEPGLARVAPALRSTYDGMGASAEEAAKAAPRRAIELAVLGALHAHGVPIVAGTDQAVPGHSLHRELELYVDAGFTPMEAIRAATAVPAEAMRRADDLGTIAPGKRADLVIVDADPLADIRNLRRISTVVAAGRAYDTASLWRLVDFVP